MSRITFAALAMAFIPLGFTCIAFAEEDKKTEQEIYIPKDLDDCFVELKKILKPKDVEKMKGGTEEDMIQYHMGLGLWMRNNWELRNGSRLEKWFNQKGIDAADDMSGIILHSFWRHLNSKPIELEQQVKHYQEYWEKVKIAKKHEEERVERAIQQIGKMMMGLSVTKTNVPIVQVKGEINNILRARYLAKFGNGVLLTIRSHDCDDFTTPGYYLDLVKKKIHPITVPEIDELQYTVVAGGVAYFSGVTKGVPVLVAVDGSSRTLLKLPEEKVSLQLGIDGKNLLAVYSNSIYVLRKTEWSEIYKGTIQLPKSGPPPQKYGDKIFFRDEGRCENGKRLWWLELTQNPQLVSLDEDIGVVGSSGPRWENSFSYCITPKGDLWATLGEGYLRMSLIKRSANGKYEIAIVNNSTQFDGELFGSNDKNDRLSVSAISIDPNGFLLLAGDHGLYTLKDKQLRQLVQIDGMDGYASNLLPLGENRFLVSGTFGGVYLIEHSDTNTYKVVCLDGNAFGEPVAF